MFWVKTQAVEHSFFSPSYPLIFCDKAKIIRENMYTLRIYLLSQVLATGLSGLYSDLPTSVSYTVDEWQSPLPVIESAVPSLTQFYLALDFCNSVLQVHITVLYH